MFMDCNFRNNITDLQNLLSMNGICYLVLVQDNKPKEIARILSSEPFGNLKSEIISSRQAFNEKLMIMKIKRNI